LFVLLNLQTFREALNRQLESPLALFFLVETAQKLQAVHHANHCFFAEYWEAMFTEDVAALENVSPV
jgi:hypothetical protein